MNKFALILVLIIIIGSFLWIIVTMFRDPHNTILKYLFSWKYRMLRRLRDVYIWGLQRTPPDDYQFFYNGAINLINNNLIEHQQPNHSIEAQELNDMLLVEQFIHHYFVDEESFSGEVFHRMYSDYRSGIYRSRDYDAVVALKKKLPIEISTNERAFNDFMKFVDAGWFDKTTAMYIVGNGRNHQHIGRAIYWICYRNGIKNPGRVFSSLWDKKPETIKGWHHPSPNETITKGIDNIVFSILKD